MVELNFFIFRIFKFYKIVNYSKLLNYYIINQLFGKLANFPNWKSLEFFKLEIFRWDTKYRIIKCRTTGVSKFQNYVY